MTELTMQEPNSFEDTTKPEEDPKTLYQIVEAIGEG